MRDGRIRALRMKMICDGGAYGLSTEGVMRKAAILAAGPYVIPNVRVDTFGIYTNNTPSGAFRSFGALQTAFATEIPSRYLRGAARARPVPNPADDPIARLTVKAQGERRRERSGVAAEPDTQGGPEECFLHSMLPRRVTVDRTSRALESYSPPLTRPARAAGSLQSRRIVRIVYRVASTSGTTRSLPFFLS